MAISGTESARVVQPPPPLHEAGADPDDPTVPRLFSLANRTSIGVYRVSSVVLENSILMSEYRFTVTGAARGLGVTLAAALLEAGSHVFCLDILSAPSPEEWRALTVKANAAGLTLRYKQVDITKPELVEQVVNEIEEEAPEMVRVLVVAAGSE
jgi:hypothetical protein